MSGFTVADVNPSSTSVGCATEGITMLVRNSHSAYRQRHLIAQAAAMLVFAAPSAAALVPLDHPDDLDTPAVVAEVLEAAAPGEVLDGAVVAQANGVDITIPVVATPAITVTTYVYKYVTLARTSNWVNKAEQLGVCRVLNGAGGSTCTISAGYTVKADVDFAFGISEGVVASNIGISASKSVSGTVSWTSAKAPVGSSFKAWAVGTSVTYKIEKWKVVKAGGRTISSLVETSRTLKAFEPVKGFAVGQ